MEAFMAALGPALDRTDDREATEALEALPSDGNESSTALDKSYESDTRLGFGTKLCSSLASSARPS